MKKIYDCPCDKCPQRTMCGSKRTECKAVKNYYNKAWYYDRDVGMKLKPMRFRK